MKATTRTRTTLCALTLLAVGALAHATLPTNGSHLIHRFSDGTQVYCQVKSGKVIAWTAADSKGRPLSGSLVGWLVRKARGKSIDVKALHARPAGEAVPRASREDLARIARAVAENESEDGDTPGRIDTTVMCYICRPDNYGNAKCERVPCDSMPFEAL